KNNMFPFFPDIHGAPYKPEEAQSFMTRFTVDMNSKSDEFESVETLTDMMGEFPRIDDRYASQPHTHGWFLVSDRSQPFHGPGSRASGFLTNTLGHINFSTGRQSSWFCGPENLIQEPCFIPRSPDAPQGDGYIVALIDNLVSNLSDLAIFDANAIEQGPFAKAKLPFR